MRESEIQRKMLLYLKGVPNLYVVNFVGSAVTAKGTPDILCCYKGKFIALEVKTPDKKNNVSDLQEHNINEIIKNGGLAYVVWELNQVKKIIEGLEK